MLNGDQRSIAIILLNLILCRSSELASRFPTIGSSRAPYIPRRSYAQCVLPHRRLPVPPSGLGKRPRKSIFTRDIVLLDDTESMIIPRGSNKSLKYDLGMIASLVELDSSWNERRVVQKIEECFKDSLDFQQPSPRYNSYNIIINNSKVEPIIDSTF